MIGFYDFDTDVDGITTAVRKASAWVDEHSVDVVNIETVVVADAIKPTPMASLMPGAGAIVSRWFVRVWYRSHKTLPIPGSVGSTSVKSDMRWQGGDEKPFKMSDV
jgi:hypothetical protein